MRKETNLYFYVKVNSLGGIYTPLEITKLFHRNKKEVISFVLKTKLV